jgi:hypothetical protein
MLLMLIVQVSPIKMVVPQRQARATVHIEQAGIASASAWQNAERKSERLSVDEQGRTLKLRLVEFE